jgi:hypothetical protein
MTCQMRPKLVAVAVAVAVTAVAAAVITVPPTRASWPTKYMVRE